MNSSVYVVVWFKSALDELAYYMRRIPLGPSKCSQHHNLNSKRILLIVLWLLVSVFPLQVSNPGWLLPMSKMFFLILYSKGKTFQCFMIYCCQTVPRTEGGEHQCVLVLSWFTSSVRYKHCAQLLVSSPTTEPLERANVEQRMWICTVCTGPLKTLDG